jgi:transposase
VPTSKKTSIDSPVKHPVKYIEAPITDHAVVTDELLARLKKMEDTVSGLSSDNSRIKRTLQSVKHENRKLKKENAKLKKENVLLKKENAELKKRLNIPPEPPCPLKNSTNSSIPPSKEDIRSSQLRMTKSLRVKSGKPVGDQSGHKGYTLSREEQADHEVMLEANYCTHCGESVGGVKGIVAETRQMIDISLPIAESTAYNVIEKSCSCCGMKLRGTFPKGVNAPVFYGPNIQAMVAYLSEAQHIPVKRLTELMKDFFGICMSTGTVCNIIEKIKAGAKPVYDNIRERVWQAPVVGADETGENVNGELFWLWVWQTEKLTCLASHKNRGQDAIEAQYPDGLKHSILVTDRLSSYFNMDVKGHQLCLAHLIRNFNYLSELDTDQTWSDQMLELLRDAIHQRKTWEWIDIDRQDIMSRLDKLPAEPLGHLDKLFGRMQRSLRKLKDAVFTFLYNPNVPYENNASERAIRKTKIKMKVSQSFRSGKGADAFAILHSIMDTARKKHQSPFLALKIIPDIQQ